MIGIELGKYSLAISIGLISLAYLSSNSIPISISLLAKYYNLIRLLIIFKYNFSGPNEVTFHILNGKSTNLNVANIKGNWVFN